MRSGIVTVAHLSRANRAPVPCLQIQSRAKSILLKSPGPRERAALVWVRSIFLCANGTVHSSRIVRALLG